MTAFELLGVSPRPFLDPETLKETFLKLSGPLHPDRVHHLSEKDRDEATQKFKELNSAYNTLADAKDRSFLLIKMETGEAPQTIQVIPDSVSDLFMEVGQACKIFDQEKEMLTPKEATTIIKALAARKKQVWQTKLQSLKEKILQEDRKCMGELKDLDQRWMQSPEHHLLFPELEKLGRQFSFLKKWSKQIDERLLQLKISS